MRLARYRGKEMSKVSFLIVPATGRARHQVSCEKVDNLSKFILNHIKMSAAIFPGMNLSAASGRVSRVFKT